ncbi:hypothetical protein SAMN05444007_10128 [Cribrihabitans marinus]|uniref:DUF2059 domain-containing protein n=1 Tax=Cribrihabitans marinus TaxID=1227549 RepID=A0A1H6QH53_9RHOB|nr:DUF2059 domain-containing protein [Cribrihabitans marinus]GGH18107.1 hypothetical protein GCM10010973_00710 [Cribrihabitans marinus]SEI39537.1 hypothetical protein SAMN05444007_10128 [Cribrihabitans marinus]
MLRSLIAAAGVALLSAGPVPAREAAAELAEVLRLQEVAEILHDEGLAYGESLDADMLGGEGGAFFRQRVEQIYATGPMVETMRGALADTMTEAQIDQTAQFFAGELGQTILSLENSARRAFSDPEVEETMRDRVEAAGRDDPRIALIGEYIRTNQLIERNVEGAISSDYSFYRGLADGRQGRRDDRMMLSDLFSRRDETRAETEDWLYGFLSLAYQPLSEAEMRENIAFSASPAGQALNAALFEGFDRLYDRISYDLGQAVARAMGASEL